MIYGVVRTAGIAEKVKTAQIMGSVFRNAM